MTDIITSLSPENMRDLLQAVGFRAEIMPAEKNGTLVRSASNGVNFDVWLFNPLPRKAGAYTDLTFTAGLQIQGQLAFDIVNHWNTTKRFGRLHVVPGVLVLTMDTLLQDGVSPAHLRTALGLWDRLVSELLLYLRAVAANGRPAPAAEAAATETKQEVETGEAVLDKVALNGHAQPDIAAAPVEAGRDEPRPALQ